MFVSKEKYQDRPHVLVVDDDDRIRGLVTRYLYEKGFYPVSAQNPEEAREALNFGVFDVLVMDIMMPEETGLEFVSKFREQGHDTPVLFLTALGEPDDRIKGFETGGDDYLPKPFEPQEMLLRLKALLKRTGFYARKGKSNYKIGPWLFDPKQAALENEDQSVRLTDMESNLLLALLEGEGSVMSREALAQKLQLSSEERTIDVQVTRLRKKIEDDRKNPKFLKTVRGKGYVLYCDEE